MAMPESGRIPGQDHGRVSWHSPRAGRAAEEKKIKKEEATAQGREKALDTREE